MNVTPTIFGERNQQRENKSQKQNRRLATEQESQKKQDKQERDAMRETNSNRHESMKENERVREKHKEVHRDTPSQTARATDEMPAVNHVLFVAKPMERCRNPRAPIYASIRQCTHDTLGCSLLN